VKLLFLWIGLWIVVACVAALVVFLVWRWWRNAFGRRSIQNPLASALVAREFLRAQAHIIRLKHQVHRASLPSEEDDNAGIDGPSTLPADHARRRSLFGQLTRWVDTLGLWLGWPSILIGLVAVGCILGGLIWEVQRHPPLPLGAVQVRETIIQGFARQTSYRVPQSIDEVRAFYQRELPNLGWRYCGTQATPHCSNLISAGAEQEIDVYRRPQDRDFSGLSIEIWPQADPNRQTFVTVFETRLRR
jgi:hypothetical protein